MARFEDNPVFTPLTGSELLAGAYPPSGVDICVALPDLMVYANEHLRLADSTVPGFLSPEDFQKLFNLPDFDSYSATVARLAKQAIGFFVAVPANGSVTFFCNPITEVNLALSKIKFKTSAGTLTLAIEINGTPITGWDAIAVTSTLGSSTLGGPAAIVEPDDLLSFTISANSSGANLFFSIMATAVP